MSSRNTLGRDRAGAKSLAMRVGGRIFERGRGGDVESREWEVEGNVRGEGVEADDSGAERCR